MGETGQLFTVLRGLWIFYIVRAELQTARELGEQLLQLAQGAQDPALLLEAHRALGETLYYLGEFSSAYAHGARNCSLRSPAASLPRLPLRSRPWGAGPSVQRMSCGISVIQIKL